MEAAAAVATAVAAVGATAAGAATSGIHTQQLSVTQGIAGALQLKLLEEDPAKSLS